ncbi:unnamed protein product [Adineta ricciae]|uniref:Uncharacterized protein n=1 Tax=Adineta ricciae TaxID=249248 RepID=A0A813WT33_ADIRI|nr:unnamed protein product [Adineta ricciae]CAF1161047.1 unnamed protein product [Adineta ricciae]
MCGKLISMLLFSILISTKGQHDDDRDLPLAPYSSERGSKAVFETLFPRGRCPERFYQSGQECLFFSTDGKMYSWNEAERMCARRVARMLNKHSQSDLNQPNMTPTKGVRALVLNTPEKTEAFRALFREYNEQNYAVRLPSDYHTLSRCLDGKDDKWPRLCTNAPYSNSTCFETVSNGPNDLCLREVECRQRYIRVACEFTLPGSPELTASTFRTCPKRGRRFFRRLPLWAWILIALGCAFLLIGIVAAIALFLRKSKQNNSSKKRAIPEPRDPPTRGSTKQEDPATQPMLKRPPPPPVPTSDYLQPRSSLDTNPNA